MAGSPLELESPVDWREGELLDAVAAALRPARVRAAYPGVWLRDDVYATHGHYSDRHNTVPLLERLGAALVARIVGEPRGGPAAVDVYEGALASMYAFIDGVVRRRPPKLDAGSEEGRLGFLLNHLITDELPASKGTVPREPVPLLSDEARISNSDPITGQAGWYDVRVRIHETGNAHHFRNIDPKDNAAFLKRAFKSGSDSLIQSDSILSLSEIADAGWLEPIVARGWIALRRSQPHVAPLAPAQYSGARHENQGYRDRQVQAEKLARVTHIRHQRIAD